MRDVTEELIASATELGNSSVELPVVKGDLIALVAVDARDGDALTQPYHTIPGHTM